MKKFIWLCLFVVGSMVAAQAEEVMDLGQIVVTPNRYVQEAAYASSNVKVITARDIADSGAFTLADVLFRQTGGHVYNKGSLKNTVLDIGGYNDAAVSNVLVLLNGRRLNPSDSSGPDLAQIPLEAIERIEIVQGGASVLYGDNAVGGVVNIITKKGRQGFSGSVATEFGSYGNRKESVEVSAGRKDVTVYAMGSTQEMNGYRANNYFRAGDGQVSADWEVTSLLDLGVEAGWHEDDYGMPSGLSMAQMASLGRRGTRTPNDHGDTRDRFIRFTSEWTPFDASGDFGTVSMDYAHRDRDIYGFFYYAPGSNDSTKTSTLNDAVGLKYKIDGEIAGRKAGLVAGVDIAQDRSHTLYQTVDPLWPAYKDIRISRKQQGYYMRTEYEVLSRLTADIGARYEDAEYTFNNRSSQIKTKADPSETLWGGGLKYDYAQGSNIFIRADETYRFLNTDEWFSRWSGLNTTLKHQSGIDHRMGVKHAFGEFAETRLTPFLTRNKNEIFLDPTVSPGNNANYGRTERRGIDAGNTFHLAGVIRQEWLKTVELNLDYRYLDAEFKGGSFNGKKIPMVSAHQMSVGFDAVTRGGLSWNLTTRFLGEQFGINDDANIKSKMKPSIVVDTRVGYKIKDRWETFVGINNLFNERYYDYLVYGAGASTNVDYYPAMDRNYVAGVKYRF